MLEKGLRFTEMRRNDWMGVMRWVFGGLGLAALLVGCKYPLEVRQDKAELAFYIEEFSQPGVQVLEMSYYRANPTKVTLTARQALQSAHLTVREVHALRGMVSRVSWALDHPDKDWTAPRTRGDS